MAAGLFPRSQRGRFCQLRDLRSSSEKHTSAPKGRNARQNSILSIRSIVLGAGQSAGPAYCRSFQTVTSLMPRASFFARDQREVRPVTDSPPGSPRDFVGAPDLHGIGTCYAEKMLKGRAFSYIYAAGRSQPSSVTTPHHILILHLL